MVTTQNMCLVIRVSMLSALNKIDSFDLHTNGGMLHSGLMGPSKHLRSLLDMKTNFSSNGFLVKLVVNMIRTSPDRHAHLYF